MLMMSSVVVPLLVRVTFLVVLLSTLCVPKFSDCGLNDARGLITIAEIETCCGLPGALSAMFNVAELLPILFALKPMVIVQLLVGASVEPHELTKVKLSGFPGASVSDTLLNMSVADPMLVTVTISECVLDRCTVPKLTLDGFRPTWGLSAVKFAVTDCGAVMVIVVLAEFAEATLPVQLLKAKPAFGVAVSGTMVVEL